MGKIKTFTIQVDAEQVNKLENQFNRINDKIKTISQFEFDNKNLVQSTQELRNVSAELTKTTNGLKKFKEASDKVEKQQKKTNETTKKGSIGLKGMVKSLGAIGLSVAVLRKVATVLKEMVYDTAEFNRRVGIATIVSGATESQAESLRQTALDLGGQTEYTAKEIANLEVAYGKLGFTAPEILNLISSTADAATVSQEDLAKTATIVGETIRSFGLETSEAGRVTDVLAKSFTSSALNLQRFGDMIGIVGAAANASNVSLEEMTAVMGVLSNAGLKATTAATSFRNILLISQTEGRSYKDVLEEISTSTTKLADANEAFGRRAAVTATILSLELKETAKLQKELENADGFSKRTADTIRKDLAGSLDKMNSSIANIKISFITQFGDSISSTVDFVTDMISATDKWISGTQQLNKTGLELTKWLNAIKVAGSIFIDLGKNVVSFFTDKVKSVNVFSHVKEQMEDFRDYYNAQLEGLEKIKNLNKAISVYKNLQATGDKSNQEFYKKAIFDLENQIRILNGLESLTDTQYKSANTFSQISAEFNSIGKDVDKAVRLRDKVLEILENNADEAGHTMTKTLKQKYFNLFVGLDKLIVDNSNSSLKTLKQSLKIVNDKLLNLNVSNKAEERKLVQTKNRLEREIKDIESRRNTKIVVGLIAKQKAIVDKLTKEVSKAASEADIITTVSELDAAKDELTRLESLGKSIGLIASLKKEIKDLSSEIDKSSSIDDIFGKQKQLYDTQQELKKLEDELKRNLALNDPTRTGLLKSDIQNLNDSADKAYLEAKKKILATESSLSEQEFALSQLDLNHKITNLENKRKYYRDDTKEYAEYSDKIQSITNKIAENAKKNTLNSDILKIQQDYLKQNQALGVNVSDSKILSQLKNSEALAINEKNLAAAKEKGNIKEIISLEKERLNLLREQTTLSKDSAIISDKTAEALNFGLDKTKQLVSINNDIKDAEYNREKDRIIQKYKAEEEAAAGNATAIEAIQKKKDADLKRLERKRFERQKKQQITLALIGGAQAIVSTLAAVPGFLDGVSLGVWRAVQIAFTVATTAAQIAKIKSTKFYAGGGYTGNGERAPRDITGYRPAGIVHENEYVIGVRDMSTDFGRSLASTAETYRTTGKIDLMALQPYISNNTISQSDMSSLAYIISSNTASAVKEAMIQLERERSFLNGSNY